MSAYEVGLTHEKLIYAIINLLWHDMAHNVSKVMLNHKHSLILFSNGQHYKIKQQLYFYCKSNKYISQSQITNNPRQDRFKLHCMLIEIYISSLTLNPSEQSEVEL